MKAILLAGGQGRRLRSITGSLPKPMVPLVGVPVLDRLLDLLRRNGFTDVCMTLCYRPEVIQEHCGDGSSYGVHLKYRIESEPRGTAGGVRACSDFYGREDFLVISGDAACSFDLLGLYRRHQQADAAVTIALYPNAEPLQYGLVLQDRQGLVQHFIEKPDWEHVMTDLVNTGIYIVSPRAMAYVPEDQPFDFAKDLFPLLLAAHEPILGVPMDGYWCDIGTPRAYYRCSLDVLDGRLSPAQPDASDDLPPQLPHADPNRRTAPCLSLYWFSSRSISSSRCAVSAAASGAFECISFEAGLAPSSSPAARSSLAAATASNCCKNRRIPRCGGFLILIACSGVRPRGPFP